MVNVFNTHTNVYHIEGNVGMQTGEKTAEIRE